jgi:hypothetical protein
MIRSRFAAGQPKLPTLIGAGCRGSAALTWVASPYRTEMGATLAPRNPQAGYQNSRKIKPKNDQPTAAGLTNV